MTEEETGPIEKPVPVTFSPPPGGVPQPFVEPPECLSVELIGKLTHDYLHTSKSVDEMAMEHGLTSKTIRTAIRRYGLDKQKGAIIRQLQQEELAAYSKFLLDNRVSTAEQHLRISGQINSAIEGLMKRASDMSAQELEDSVKKLKDVAGLYRSLAETLSAASLVGARSVALSGLTSEQVSGPPSGAKTPLVSLSFSVTQAPSPQATPRGETLDAEFTEAT